MVHAIGFMGLQDVDKTKFLEVMEMLIQEVCALLKQELLENGYEYGFFLDGITHKPDMTKGFDKEFFERLLTEYRIQDPKDTMKAKVGTCNDVVVLMKSILDDLSIPSKIWLLHDKQNSKFHTVLTFFLERKAIYLELTPQSGKPWYGQEIVFDSEQSFVDEYAAENVTGSLVYIQTPHHKLLLDAGFVQSNDMEEDYRRNSRNFKEFKFN